MYIILYYHTEDCIVHLTSFFDHQFIVSSRILLYTMITFVWVWSVYWSITIYEKYIMIPLQLPVLIVDLFIEYNVLIIIICPYLFFDSFIKSHFLIITILRDNHSYFSFNLTWWCSGKWQWDWTISIFRFLNFHKKWYESYLPIS